MARDARVRGVMVEPAPLVHADPRARTGDPRLPETCGRPAATDPRRDDWATIDTPVQFMIDDLKTEALRLWAAEPSARRAAPVAVLIAGGARNSGGGNAIAASAFMTAPPAGGCPSSSSPLRRLR
jgi:hypothetical protein